jgi:phenylacetyl-CoA:acceptor oxidoreductase subunit 2
VSFGPNPWQQKTWDWRAAGNFICGGAGSGLILFAAAAGVRGFTAAALLLAGLALIGTGLACVWFELGRPLRALHVFFNARTSWMTRESIAATMLFPVGAAAAVAAFLGAANLVWLAALLALAFIYCQSRMLQAARGITAWSEPLSVPLLLATGLAEGAGLFWFAQPWHAHGGAGLLLLFVVLLLARAAIWLVYRRRVDARLAGRARAALDRAGRGLLVGGTAVPLALLLPALTGSSAAAAFAAVSGLVAMLAGAYLKFVLVTRAGFNRGFAVQEIPVRGARPFSG